MMQMIYEPHTQFRQIRKAAEMLLEQINKTKKSRKM